MTAIVFTVLVSGSVPSFFSNNSSVVHFQYSVDRLLVLYMCKNSVRHQFVVNRSRSFTFSSNLVVNFPETDEDFNEE